MRAMSVKLLRTKSYLAMIRNAARGENHMFQTLFAEVDGVEEDIVRGGARSCGLFVSGVLLMNGLIAEMHAGVGGLERDMRASGWQLIDELREGAVIVWEARPGTDGSMHDHTGFFVGGEEAVSNDSNGTLIPHTHHYTYGNTRKIIRIYWHSKLDA